MASITREPNGRRTVQFVGADRKRRSIRLGKVTQRLADAVRVKVESLVSSMITGHAPDDETSRWVAGLDHVMSGKLAAVGLMPKRSSDVLEMFIDDYIEMRSDVKPRTRINLKQTKCWLVKYFKADKRLRDITEGDAEAWGLWMAEQGSAENTIRRNCGRARQLFKYAIKKKIIACNPFCDLKRRCSRIRSGSISSRVPKLMPCLRSVLMRSGGSYSRWPVSAGSGVPAKFSRCGGAISIGSSVASRSRVLKRNISKAKNLA